MQTVFESVTVGVEIIRNICIFSVFSKISDFVVQIIVYHMEDEF